MLQVRQSNVIQCHKEKALVGIHRKLFDTQCSGDAAADENAQKPMWWRDFEQKRRDIEDSQVIDKKNKDNRLTEFP